MIDYFTKNKESYAHLTDEDMIKKIDDYCARHLKIISDKNTNPVKISLSGLFLGMSENSGDLLHAANDRFGIENRQNLNPHHFLAKIAEAATRKGIKGTENIARYADIYNRTVILLKQMPKERVSGVSGFMTRIRTMHNVALSSRPKP